MKKSAFFILIAILLHSCVSLEQMASDSNISMNDVNKIPKKTTVFEVESTKTPAILYDEIMHIVIANNLSVTKNDNKYHFITTETSVNGFGHKMNVTITESQNGAKATFNSEYSVTLNSSAAYWHQAIYWGGSDKPTYAIIKTFGIVSKIENVNIKFYYNVNGKHEKL